MRYLGPFNERSQGGSVCMAPWIRSQEYTAVHAMLTGGSVEDLTQGECNKVEYCKIVKLMY